VCPLDPRLFAPRFRQIVGTLVTHGKAGVCARISVKAGVERLEKNEDTSQPEFTADTARYDKRAATFHDDHVSLSTVDGRITADYVLPNDETDTPFEAYLDGEEWEFRTSTLHYKPFEDEFWLHIGFKRTEDDTETGTDSTQADAAVPEHNTVLGIDLGVETLAVASYCRL